MKLPSLLTGVLSTVLVLLPLAASAQPAPAAPPDAMEAGRIHFNSAVAMFGEGDYRGAVVEFRRAYDVSHNYRSLYNIGQTEFELQDYAGALASFQKYLLAGGAEIDPERRAAVEADIKKLNTRVARLDVKTSTVGADVLVDDIVVGRTPLSASLVVSAGRRKITLQKGDLAPVTRVLDIAGGDASAVTIELLAPKPLAPVAVAVGGTQPPPAPARTGFWVSLTATGVLTAGAVVSGVLALGAHGDTEAMLAKRGVSAVDVEASHTKTANLSLATDVLGGASVAMGVVTILVGTLGGKGGAVEPKPAVTLGLGPTGARVFGRF
jgi:hypothetical protein